MTRTGFTKSKGVTYFHYKFSELRKFIEHGLKHGDVGIILVRRNETFSIYKGFGTIENPFNYILTISVVHNPLFSEKPTDEQLVLPPDPLFDLSSSRIEILDFSKPKQYPIQLKIIE